MNFSGSIPDIKFYGNLDKETINSNKVSETLYMRMRMRRSVVDEDLVLNYLRKIELNSKNTCDALATALLDFEKNFKKAIQLNDSNVTSKVLEYIRSYNDSALILQAIRILFKNIFHEDCGKSKFSEKSFALMNCLKADVDILFDGDYQSLDNNFFHRLNQCIISLGEQINIDVVNQTSSRAFVEGPRSPDACLLQLIIFMKESKLNFDALTDEATALFKGGVVGDVEVNVLINKLMEYLENNPRGAHQNYKLYIGGIKRGINFISDKKIKIYFEKDSPEKIIYQRELAVAKNAVYFDSMFTRLYESSLAFNLEKSLQNNTEFTGKLLKPLISILKLCVEKLILKIDGGSYSPDTLKKIKAELQVYLEDFNKNLEQGVVKNVPSSEMEKHFAGRCFENLDLLSFFKSELKCIKEIERQRDNSNVDMISIIPHIRLVFQFSDQIETAESAVPAGNNFYSRHISPSKNSRNTNETSEFEKLNITRKPFFNIYDHSLLNFTGNHFGLMSRGQVLYYPDGFVKKPEKPNFRTHTSDYYLTKINPFLADNIRISKENQYILDHGLLLCSGVSGTVWGDLNSLADANYFIKNKSTENLVKVNEKLYALQCCISMVKLGGHSFYEALWAVKESILQDVILKDDTNAKKIVTTYSEVTENGLNMSIIARDKMMRFLLSDIKDGLKIISNVENEAFYFVQEEFKKHDKFYQNMA